MKQLIFSAFLLAFTSSVYSQNNEREFEYTTNDTTYTMKQYHLLIFLSGDNKDDKTEEEGKKLMEGHLANINSMADAGIVHLAGPIDGNTEKRGILVFDVDSTEEIDRWMQNDPLVKANILTYEVHPWWAAKGSCLK